MRDGVTELGRSSSQVQPQLMPVANFARPILEEWILEVFKIYQGYQQIENSLTINDGETHTVFSVEQRETSSDYKSLRQAE